MKFFWRKKQPALVEDKNRDKHHDAFLQRIQDLVAERKALWRDMQAHYQPENDSKQSTIWYFLKGEINPTKLSADYLKAYEAKYQVQLPPIVKRLLTEVGSGKLLNHNFVNRKGELYAPEYCLELDFLQTCLDQGIDPLYLEQEMADAYDVATNRFHQAELQAIYEARKAKRDENIVLLFPLGGHSTYLTLNRDRKEDIAIFDIAGICNQSIKIDGREYDFPYYRYEEGTIAASILQNINTAYWEEMLYKIKERNQAGKA